MDWLNGVPSPRLPNWQGFRTEWNLNIPSELQSYYLNCFSRGRWWEEPGHFPVEELEELCRVMSLEDQKNVWHAFSEPVRIQFGSDVLKLLMNLGETYPVPVSAYPKCVRPGIVPSAYRVPWNVNPGPVTCMNVEIPEDMKRYEMNTNWSEFQCWVGPWHGVQGKESRMPCFAYLLDQLDLGSAENPSDGIHFEAVMRMESPPWNHLAELARSFPVEEQIQIVYDWGLIMRIAGSSREGPNQIGWMGRSLASRRERLERACLQFLTKRLVYEKLKN